MRGRRPSVLAGTPSGSTSTTRVAKSSDFGGLSHSNLSSSASATPQQKTVQVLVARLKQKLPCNSGLSLDELEADTAMQQVVEALVTLSYDSMDIIAWALSELLERLAIPDKDQPQPLVLPIEVLQSQLFVLKVLSVAMASRWYHGQRPGSRASNESPVPRRGRHSSDQHSGTSALSEPPRWTTPMSDPPLMLVDQTTDIAFSDYEMGVGESSTVLDELLLWEVPRELRPRASHSSSLRSGKGSFSSSIPIPVSSTRYEVTAQSTIKSSLALNALLAKFTGRIIFHLSASNWKIVFLRLRNKLHFLASDFDRAKMAPDLVDLQLLAHCTLNRERLLLVLHELSSLLLNMKEEHTALAPALRVAVWNWIDQYPEEFNEAARMRGGMEGGPERVFDLLYPLSKTTESQKIVWPALAIINAISSDRLSPDLIQHPAATRAKTSRPDVKFSEDILRHAQIQSKLSESALICAIDLCRVASRVQPEGEVPVRLLAYDIAPELKSALTNSAGRPFWDQPEEIDVAIYAQAMTMVFRFLPEEDSLPLFALCVEPERSEAVKLCAVRACLTLVQEAPRTPSQKSLNRLIEAMGGRLQEIFKTAAMRRTELDQHGNMRRTALRPKCRRRVPQPLSDREVLILGILALWRVSPDFFHIPVCLLSFSSNLLRARTDAESTRMWTAAIYRILKLYAMKTENDSVRECQNDDGRTPAFVLVEIALLVTLTSEDTNVSYLAAKGLRHLAYLESVPGAPPAPVVDDELRSKRHLVYEQLGDPRVLIKRMRKLIRLLSFPSAIHIAVWEECYWRWRSLLNTLVDSMAQAAEATQAGREKIQLLMQEKRHLWQNLTLFLAALGGACVQDDVDLGFLASVVSTQYLPDEMRTMQNPANLVKVFVSDVTDQLVTDDVHFREVAKNALGAELSPRLYSRLLKHFDDTIRQITPRVGNELVESYSLFVDQFIAVLKLIIENTHVRPEEIMSIDISQTMLALASFIARFDSQSALRLRLKFCNLCDAVCDRTDTLTLRKDSPARQKILDFVMEWMETSPPTSAQDLSPTQNDLNMTCLRTCVKLLDRLQIRPLDDTITGDDSVHVVSRLFHNTSEAQSFHKKNRAVQREAELRELVITGLSHLVGANSENGFKQCLPLAYDADNRKRAIFANVFARVIGQGTKFDLEDHSSNMGRHNRLSELVKGSDMVLVMAICETCPPGEVEIMISVMLNLFDTRSTLMALLKHMIDREVANTDSEAALFRSNSTCTRFLSAFAKVHGYAYLRSLIIPLIKSMASLPTGHGYELDPEKPDVGEARAAQNLENVKFVAASFLEIITSSIPALPPMFREICAHISKVVSKVWPEAKFSAMGAFIFLRFISPAIVAPETIDVELPKDLMKEEHMVIRRGLMVIAKIIQNLANNLFFGKEKHMVPLNTFLQANIASVTRFLSELNKYQAPIADEETDEWLGTTSDDTDIIVLHRYFHKHADKIGKELLSLSKPSDNDPSAISGKHAWDELCGLLVELGTPLDIPRLSSASSHEHRDYMDLMSRHAHRGTETVKGIFLETDTPMDEPAVFLLCLSKIDVEALDIELLMFHIFKTLALPAYQNRSFDVVLDCTAFTGISELPLQWLKFCAELIPYDIRTRFSTTHILNSNTLTQKYMRRLYNFAAGTPFCSVIRAYSSVVDLVAQVPQSAVAKLLYPLALESEVGEQFSDISMRLQQMRFPIVLLVGESHIRITSVRAQSISPGLSCKSTEIIPLMDVSDVYNVSSIGQDAHEFIIRRAQQGTTVYFSSPSREAIVKAIRSAKGRLKDTPIPLAERFSRFSNIPATLLHVGMLSVDLNDEDLRAAGYELLGAVCSYLNFDKSPIVAPKSGFVPGDPRTFIVSLSESLAAFAPQLTLDFLSEIAAAMTGIDRAAISQRISCIQYMRPWIKNLALFVNPTSPLYERSGARVRDAIRVLCDMSTGQPELTAGTQRYVWSEMGRLDPLLIDVALDEMIRAATDGGVGSSRCETIGLLLASMTSISVRAKLSLTKQTGTKQPKTLQDYPNWAEISTLVRLCHVAGYQAQRPNHNLLYVPEILHLVTLTSGVGPPLVRKSVYGIIINLLQAVHIGRSEDAPASDLLQLLADCESQESLMLFGLARATQSSEYTNHDPVSDIARVDNQEKLTELLSRILEVTAGFAECLASTVDGARDVFCLPILPRGADAVVHDAWDSANTGSDDDYLYQMLVALRTALTQANEAESAIVVTMLRSLAKVIPALPDNSRYLTQLFWLAVALLESSHVPLYVEASRLLSVTLESMRTRGMFRHASVSTVLLEGRDPLESILSQLDNMLSISFDANFSFALASVIFKGVRPSILRDAAESVLRTLLSVTMKPYTREHETNGFRESLLPDALGYFVALLPFSTTHAAYRRLLKDCNVGEAWFPEVNVLDDNVDAPRIQAAFLGIDSSTTALLTASFIGSVLTTAQGNDAETEMLYSLLSDIGASYPEIVAMLYDGLQGKIRDIFSKSSNPAIIRSVSTIFRVAQEHDRPRFGTALSRGSASTLSTVEESSAYTPGRSHLEALDELSMGGLANNFVFLTGGNATKMIQWIPELVNLMVM
ncbi:hypothetical protein B0H10DRAFT_2233906 [Mycena sp. CBHHK59/15]|nr:hypothetical protein B0H10DRAFT_2233906 [Mycena sp. CBHHK59/15]